MSLAQRAFAGATWSVLSFAGRRFTTVLTAVILARLLTAADFGVMAMALVFIGFIDLVRDMGTGAGVVQVESPSERLLSTLFWTNVLLGLAGSIGLMLLAPAAAALFREPRLIPVLRTLALSPAFASLSVVHASLLARHLHFRRLTLAELVGAVLGGVVGAGLAFAGYGVWSLVLQHVCGAFVVSAGIWIASRWTPRLVFDARSVQAIWRFSGNLTLANVIAWLHRNADSFLIGRYLGAQDLGIYDLAYRLMVSSLQLLSGAFARALFPVYSRMQHDDERLGSAYLRVVAATALIACPIMFGLLGVADPFVQVVFGSQWAPAVVPLRILAPVGALQAVGGTVLSLYQAKGRTDLLLRWTAVSGALTILAIVIGLRWGILGVAVCYAMVWYALAYHLFKIPLALIRMPMQPLIRTLARPLLCSVFMLAVPSLLQWLLLEEFGQVARLLILVPAGATAYAGSTWLFNHESLYQVADLSRSTLRRDASTPEPPERIRAAEHRSVT